MLCSMTGYGQATITDQQITYMLEIRSVNNRYFKANIKLPESFGCHEPDIEQLLRKELHRGSIIYQLKLRDVSPQAAYQINQAAMLAYARAAQESAEQADLNNWTLNIGSLMTLPGVCQPPEPDPQGRSRQWKIISQLTEQTLAELMKMRQQEGSAMQDDILNHCRQISDHLQVVVQRAPLVVTEYAQKLDQRIKKLLTDVEIELDKDSLAREIAIFAERCDINEEQARLACHLEQFGQIIENQNRCGRKLEFLAQEMLREANTIGSKANDSTITQHVVDIKGLIDRIKEQVQNVE